MFPNKQRSLGGLKKPIRKIDDTRKVDRRSVTGRPRTARLPDKIDEVNDLVLSQDNAPKTHKTQRQIARQTGVSLTSVDKNDLRLNCKKNEETPCILRSQRDCTERPLSQTAQALSSIYGELSLV